MAENQADDAEKTEEPTQKRLDDAHAKGDVPKSQEVNTWFVIFGATLIVLIFAGDLARSLGSAVTAFLERPHSMAMDGENVRLLALTGLRVATIPETKADTFKQQEEWMLRLGGALQAA